MGYSINSSGNLVVATNPNSMSTIDYMPITPSKTYVVSDDGVTISPGLVVVAFYDTSKTFISRVTTGITTFTSPANAAYYRITGVSLSEKVQIEQGSTITPYEPYWKFNKAHLIDNFGIADRGVTPFKVDGNYSQELLKIAGKLDVATPDSTYDGYYAYNPASKEIVGPTSSSGFKTLYFNINDSLPFYYSGKLLGSAHVAMGVYLDANDDPIGITGIYSSSTAVTYSNYMVEPIENAVKIAFCFYTQDSTPYSIKRYAKEVNESLTKVVPSASADSFIGHNNLPRFNTDYCQVIFYGQSLSNGSDSLYVTDTALSECYELGALATPSATLNPLQLGSGDQQHPVVSTVNCLHDLIWNNTNLRPSLIAGSYGAGGQSIAQLMSATRQAEIKAEEGYDYDIQTSGKYQVFLNALSYAKQVATANNKTISCPVIVFLHGERDYYSDEELSGQAGSVVQAYACGGDKDKYKLYMSRLKNDMQSACVSTLGQSVKPLFAIYQVSGKFVHNHEMTINMAQVEFAEENDDVILLPSPYFVPNYSSSHLSTNGYRWYGEFVAEAIFKTLVQRSEFKPLQMVDAKVDGTNIIVKVKNGYLPIKIDNYTVEQANGYGFAIWKNGARVVLHGISIYGDEITVKTNDDLTSASTLEISYGGMEVDGTGNIRDTSPYKSKYTYWNDANDKGQSGTLTISHIPEDKDGNTIVGEKYPMWNWLASFYKEF